MKPLAELDSKVFPTDRRAMAFRDVAAHMCLLDVTPNPNVEFESVIRLFELPGLRISRLRWSAATTARSTDQAYATGDNVIVHIPLGGQFRIQQAGGKEVTCRPGEVYIDPTEVRGIDVFEAPSSEMLYLSLPRETLVALGGEAIENYLRRKLVLDGPWQLLLGYVQTLTSPHVEVSGEQLQRCSNHLQDLLAMALQARPNGTPPVRNNGVRAARLQGIKQLIEVNLANPQLSPDFIAQRCGISQRYIRDLFAEANTTLSDYVQQQRLQRAHLLLTTNPDPKLRISDVAYSSGFGDLSWFNNLFKKRFGLTPREARHLTLGATD